MDGENNYSMEITNGQLIMDGSSPVVLPQGVMDIVAGNAFTLETWIEINQATAYDNYMDAYAAIEFGICDSIRGLF